MERRHKTAFGETELDNETEADWITFWEGGSTKSAARTTENYHKARALMKNKPDRLVTAYITEVKEELGARSSSHA
jgi:hypothetical protein